nr:hypothetical protein [Lysinibacillus timonensis]
MSLNKMTFFQVVRKQVKWKCKAYSQSFITLIIIQVILSLLAFNGSGMSGTGTNDLQLDITFYSLDTLVIISCICAFITALLLQSKDNIQDDYSIVSSRITSSFSNSIFIIIYSFIATITTFTSFYISVLMVQLISNTVLIREGVLINPIQFMVVFFILLLAASSGFFLGAAFYRAKMLGIGIIILSIVVINNVFEEQLLTLLTFFFEQGYLLFILKGIVVAMVLMSLSILLHSRKEVSRR